MRGVAPLALHEALEGQGQDADHPGRAVGPGGRPQVGDGLVELVLQVVGMTERCLGDAELGRPAIRLELGGASCRGHHVDGAAEAEDGAHLGRGGLDRPGAVRQRTVVVQALERAEVARHRLLVTGQARHPGRRHVGRGSAVAGTQDVEPPLDGGGLTGVHEPQPVGLDELGCVRCPSGREPVRDRFRDETVGGVPLGGPGVELLDALGARQLQLAAGDGGEELVETEPRAITVERHQEQVGAFEVVEDRRAVTASQQVVAQSSREPVQHRDVEDEVPQPLRMPAEDLLGEVVPDEPVAPAEAVHEVVGVRSVGEGERGEVEGRGPALGPFDQLGEGVVREGDARAGDHLARLLRREGQVLGPELGQVVGHAQPPQPESGVGPGDDHHVGLLRQALHEELDLLVACGQLDEVEVVEDEHQVVRHGRQRCHDRRQQGRGRLQAPAEHPRGFDEGQHAPRPFEGRGHVAPQPHRVVVAGIEGDPRGVGTLLVLQRLRHHGGLAVAGRAATRVTGRRTAWAMASIRRGRSTQLARRDGGWSFTSDRWSMDGTRTAPRTGGSDPEALIGQPPLPLPVSPERLLTRS